MFHDSPVGMVITTVAESRYVEVNAAFARLLGYARDELIGQPFSAMELDDVQERGMVLEVLKRVNNIGDVPLLLRTRDGESRACIYSVQLQEIGGEKYFICMVQDLSEHERVQADLQVSENRFRLFFQSIPLPLIVFDEKALRILDVNTAAREVYGFTHEEFTSLTIEELIPAEDRPAFNLSIRQSGNSPSGKLIIGRQQMKDGSIIDVEMTSYSFPLDERRVSLSIIRDVTEKRIVESALQASEERFRIIADVMTDAIWERDLTTDAVQWSPGLSWLFGHFDDGDRPHPWWIDHVHPEDREAVEASIETAFASDEVYWTAEYRFLRADGGYANVLDHGYIVRGNDGRPTHFIGAMVDITEQLHVAEAAERASQEERQRLAKDLHESVTQSLYSVSLMAEAARRRAAVGEQQMTAEFIARLGELSRQALRQLRLLVYELRPGVLEQEGLAGALRHRLEAVEQRAGIQARLIEENETHVPSALKGELFWIGQEALNNALKHAAATTVIVHLRESESHIILEVRDDGRGFDPTAAGATGGLAAMRRRVEVLGGNLDVEAQHGRGALVRARIPTPAANLATTD